MNSNLSYFPNSMYGKLINFLIHCFIFPFITSIILFFCPAYPLYADINDLNNQNSFKTDIDLPSALKEDDSFDDLPFEQLRQALREEVEHDPKRRIIPRSSKRYNLLIR